MMSLFLFELKYYFKNIREAIYFIGLFFSVVMLVPFSHSALELQQNSLTSSILWIALTLAISVNGNHLFQRDADAGRLEQYQLLPVTLELLVLGKWIAYWASVTLPLMVIFPAIALLLNIDVADWPRYLIGLMSGAEALSLITALASAVMTGAAKAGAMLNLFILPLTIPVVIFGSQYLATNTGHIVEPGLLFLWGFSLFLLPVLCFGGAACIRSAN